MYMLDIFVHPITLLATHSYLRMLLVRAHNTIRARYVSDVYTMYGFETFYVTMLLQLFVRSAEYVANAQICTNWTHRRAVPLS